MIDCNSNPFDTLNETVKADSDYRLVIPLGEPCEGFDYEKGCPGHRLPD